MFSHMLSRPQFSIEPRLTFPKHDSLLSEFLDEFSSPSVALNSFSQRPDSLVRSTRKAPLSQVSTTNDKFEVKLDVSHFGHNEINVKVLRNFVVVEGKHEEKSDDDSGFISRQLVHHIALPEGTVRDQMNCKMISNNTIVISAPRVSSKPAIRERMIPIAFPAQ